MSIQYINAARRARVNSPLRKLLLLMLADHANSDGVCWPSQQTLADECEMAIRSVRNHLRALEEAGYVITRPVYHAGERVGTIYKLTINDDGTPGGKEPSDGDMAMAKTAMAGGIKRREGGENGAAETPPPAANGDNGGAAANAAKPSRSLFNRQEYPPPLGSPPRAQSAAKSPGKGVRFQNSEYAGRVPEQWIAWAVKQGLSPQSARWEAAKFTDYWLAATGQKACKRSWPATWRNWIRRALEDRHAKRRESPYREGVRRIAEWLAEGSGGTGPDCGGDAGVGALAGPGGHHDAAAAPDDGYFLLPPDAGSGGDP